MMSKTYIAGLCIAVVTTEAMQVNVVQDEDIVEEESSSNANTVSITDMDTVNYFHHKNSVYNTKTASEKKDDLWTEITEDDTMMPYYWKEFNELFSGAADGSFC